jgi:hypothetical protein
MSQNPGWLHRVLGVADELELARAQIAARDQRIARLEQQLASHPGATLASERERELAEKLALAIADRVSLAAEAAEVQQRLAAHESALASEAERATTLGKAAAAANRRAELRYTEVQTLEKQRIHAEASAAAARAALEQLEATNATRERELSSKNDALTSAEWKNDALERELEHARSELQRARGAQQSLASLQRELADQRTEREQLDAALQGARAAEARLTGELASARERDAAQRAALRGVIDLSAHALHRTLGAAAHLALELGVERSLGFGLALDGNLSDGSVRQLNEHLALLGVADELSVQRDGDGFQGGFRLWNAGTDPLPLARWVAAYAVQLFGASAPEPLRLESLSGGPSEYRFSAAPRAVSQPRSRQVANGAALAEGEPAPQH